MLFASICCSHLSTESKVSRFGMCQDLQALEKWSDMTWKFQLEVVECFLHRHTRKKAGQTSTSCCESLLWNVVKHCSTPFLIPRNPPRCFGIFDFASSSDLIRLHPTDFHLHGWLLEFWPEPSQLLNASVDLCEQHFLRSRAHFELSEPDFAGCVLRRQVISLPQLSSLLHFCPRSKEPREWQQGCEH